MPQTDERPLPDFVKNFPPEIAEAELKRQRPEEPKPVPAFIEENPGPPEER